MKYLPFGETLSGSVPTDKKFTGQRLDETGLYYYNARYYDATIGRFISPDTIIQSPANPQDFNRYTYCLNNPLKYTDPTGYFISGTTEIDGIEYQIIDEGNDMFHLEAPDGSVTGSFTIHDLLVYLSLYMIEVGDYGAGSTEDGPVICFNIQHPAMEGWSIPVYLLPESHWYAQELDERGYWGMTVTFGGQWVKVGGANVRWEVLNSWGIEFLILHEAYHAWETYVYGPSSILGYQWSRLFNEYNYIPAEIRANYFALFGMILDYSRPIINKDFLVQLMDELIINGIYGN